MIKRILMIAMLSVCVCAQADTNDLVNEVKSSVKSSWRKIAKYSDKTVELINELKTLPDKSYWFWVTDRRDQNKKIRKQLRKVREILLSTNAQEIMEDIDDIDSDIADLNEDIREVKENRQLDPDKRAKYDEKLDKLMAKKTDLEARRRERAKVVCAELRSLGLNVGGEAAENCLFTINFGDLIDGVVVAKNVSCVVENLRELMATGDVDAARRYFGMYLVMVDVQIDCFESYIDKSQHGEWRGRIGRIICDASLARQKAYMAAEEDGYSEEQKKIFLNNAKINESTMSAADAYLRVLDAHEKIINDKLTAARRIREVVANSLETVNLAGDFLRLAKSNQDAFDSLLQLDLPPIEMFNDAAVQQEFLAITKKLKE